MSVNMVPTNESIRRHAELERSQCVKCGVHDMTVLQEDMVEYFATLASKYGAKAEVVSGRAEYGKMITNLGGVAVLLKYKSDYLDKVLRTKIMLFFILTIMYIVIFFPQIIAT